MSEYCPFQDINFWGNVYPTYVALPYLRQSRGRVIVNASVESWLPLPRMSLYAVSDSDHCYLFLLMEFVQYENWITQYFFVSPLFHLSPSGSFVAFSLWEMIICVSYYNIGSESSTCKFLWDLEIRGGRWRRGHNSDTRMDWDWNDRWKIHARGRCWDAVEGRKRSKSPYSEKNCVTCPRLWTSIDRMKMLILKFNRLYWSVLSVKLEWT